MFEVDVTAEGYNRMSFKFETLEDAQKFAGVLFASVDEEKTTNLCVTVRYTKVYKKEEKE